MKTGHDFSEKKCSEANNFDNKKQMNRFYRIFCLISGLFALAGCVKDKYPYPWNIPVEVKFKSNIMQETESKSAEAVLEKGDKVGIFMLKQGEDIAGVSPKTYMVDTASYIRPEAEPWMYPSGVNVSFYSYFPSSVTIKDGLFDVSSGSDFIFSNNEEAMNKRKVYSSAHVLLKYRHALTKLRIRVEGEKIESLALKVRGFYTSARLDIVSGIFSEKLSSEVSLSPVTGEDNVYEVYVIPSLLSEMEMPVLVVDNEGGHHEVEMQLPEEIQSGSVIEQPVRIDEGTSVSLGDISISPWHVEQKDGISISFKK